MKVYITAKRIRKRGNQVESCPYELRTSPKTLRQLITILVSDSVEGYNRRLQSNADAFVLTQDDMDAMSLVGKIGFGLPFGSREADLHDALVAALQGFEDGLYRLFVGDQEIESLDERLDIMEGDIITIIRLVMLTGGFF